MRPAGWLRLVVVVATTVAWPQPARGQGQPYPSSPTPTFSLTSLHPERGAESVVSFLDSAVPRSQMRTRLDLGYDNHRPTRAEFVWPKSGLPFSPGPPLPETNLDIQEWSTSLEIALGEQFSFFLETPVRWANPEVNANQHGLGDVSGGFKWAFIKQENLVTAFQFRGYFPTASEAALGTDHYALEPALLVNYHLAEFLLLEGEVRYWLPLGGTDFAGDVVRYGLGLSFGQRPAGEIWLTPVAEVVGWTVLDGKVMAANSPELFTVESAAGTTIVNGCLGVRLGLGDSCDFYCGYARAFSGHSWFKDLFRLEFRMNF
jgi:hypothetical protein